MDDRRVALGEAEDAPRRVLVADRRVAAADPEVGGGEHHRHRRLAEVVAVDRRGSARPPGRARSARSSPAMPGMCRAPCHTVPSSASWSRSVTTMKSHFWRFDADGERHPASRMRSRSAACDRLVGVGPHVAARPDGVPCLHAAKVRAIVDAMNGAQAMIRTLVDAGVTTCFTNPGTSEMHFVAALDIGAGDARRARPVRGRRHRRRRRLRPHGRRAGVHAAAPRARVSATASPTCTTPGGAKTPIVNIVGDHATYHARFDAPLASDIETAARNVSPLDRPARAHRRPVPGHRRGRVRGDRAARARSPR